MSKHTTNCQQTVRRYLAIGLLFLQGIVRAQAPAALPATYNSNIKVNYVRTWNAKAPDTGSASLVTRVLKDVQQTTAYFDGLGRPLQTVVKQGSLTTGSSPVDLVSPVIYDEFGREKYKYLPFAANNAGSNGSISDGLFKLNPFQQQVQFYNAQLTGQSGETNVGSNSLNWAYSQTAFEASPLNRVQESFAPGSSWVGSTARSAENDRRSVKAKYLINTIADSVRVWTVTDVANDWGTYATAAIYTAGELYKNITVDEHSKQIVEFKDKEGQVILKKVQLTATADNGSGSGHTGWLCTYYLYDDLNRLRLVIQPRGVEYLLAAAWSNSSLINQALPNLSFRYEYDQRGRMVRKKVPDAGEVWMVYDARDRLVLSQTAQMRSRKQWLYTQYDELNRQIATGLIPDNTNYNNYTYHQVRADTSTSYPNLNNYTEEELTRNFYDDYTWRSSYSNPLSDTYNTSYNTYLQTASNTTWPYPQANVQTSLTKGLLTGTRAKIVGSSNTYLYTVNIYDEKGRVIQTLATNMASGEEHSTTQYTFSGQPLVIVLRTRKAGSNNPQTHVVATTMTYDDLGRVLTIKKDLHSFFNNTNQHLYKPQQVIVQHEYDAQGQLKTKKLLPTGGSGGGPLETLSYDYNIRGWMLGTNRSYAKDTNSTTSHFGFELAYDKNALAVNNLTDNYADTLFNGNIAGMLWKSAGDSRVRRYDFTYDAVNRLTNAYFKQFTGSGFNLNAGVDFSATGLSYDVNGNILSMNQRGLKANKSETIDSLVYNYLDYSNRLKNVIDHFNDTATTLGDFRASAKYVNDLGAPKNTNTTDYGYDVDGSLVKDLNKNLGDASNNGIVYNHLNLPASILVKKAGGGNKGLIQYYYDAFGIKLRKVVSDSSVNPVKVTTTTYLGGCVYENDTLQFIGYEEGRLRYVKRRFLSGDTAYQFQYDFFLKDHLGNIRMVLTEQTDTAHYIATLEAAYRAKENQLFYNIPQTNYSKALVPGGYPTDNTTVPNDSLARTNGSNNKIGPAIVLKVMSGDKVDIAVKSFYLGSGAGSGTNDPIADILTSLATGIVGMAGESKGTLSALGNSGSSPLLGALNSFRNEENATPSNKPKAYLNWILLDEQLQYVSASSGADLIKDTGNIYALTSGGLVTMTRNGFLYIYVSNETQNRDVFFDNLSVQHYTGPITEETHYYPFGLTMAGISSKALKPSYVENDKKYNGIEFEGDMGLEVYDAQLRELDPQMGRWWQIDPKTENMEMWSPYASNYDNPIRYSDLLGDEGEECCRGLRLALASGAGALNGLLNGLTFGAWSTKPISSTQYTDEELAYYNKAVQVGQLSTLPTSMMINPLSPLSLSTEGSAVSLTPTIPLFSPATPGDRVNSSSSEDPAESSSNSASEKSPYDIGKEGMDATGLKQNTTRIPSATETAQYRVPDVLTDNTIAEVKNVKKLSLSNQIKDYIAYSQEKGLILDLHVRPTTVLSKPLQQKIVDGSINLKILPK
ncbi:hypothetical protein HB364_27640 [Pseudoflavitalea sp. X16]|uniref:DUF6443 domain-containing protein n=1 Tax=Paraflavitalea devenefica TaxID=2716334 RepID=UPI00141E69FB|nr:DUF6443 domain-containing protein [Paraflavitalea devenefica]NII28882.1 hypothetical protein [Paraflavitalea devenefica]